MPVAAEENKEPLREKSEMANSQRSKANESG